MSHPIYSEGLEPLSAATERISRMPTGMRIFLLALGGSIFLCGLSESVCRWVLHLGYPYNWPLMFPHSSFMDFRWYFQHFQTFHTDSFFQGPDIIMYPAPVVVCYWLFYRLQPVATPCFLGFIVVLTVAATIFFSRSLQQHGLAKVSANGFLVGVYLMSYPLWFELKQANMEILVWVVVSLGLLAWLKQRSWLAAALFGVAGAMKIFPLIFLGLLLSRKRYRECIFGCVVLLIVSVASLWFVGPTAAAAWHGTEANLAVHREQFLLVLRPNESGFDHSLFALVKYAMRFLHHFFGFSFSQRKRSAILSAYLLCSAMVGSWLYFSRIRHLPVTNQVLTLSVASILLSPISFDYTLLHLYASLALLCCVALRAAKQQVQVRGLNLAFVCMALSLAPLSELIVLHDRIGGQARAFALLALFIVGLLFPFPLAWDRDENRSDWKAGSVHAF